MEKREMTEGEYLEIMLKLKPDHTLEEGFEYFSSQPHHVLIAVNKSETSWLTDVIDVHSHIAEGELQAEPNRVLHDSRTGEESQVLPGPLGLTRTPIPAQNMPKALA
jgi:hypothetical protein